MGVVSVCQVNSLPRPRTQQTPLHSWSSWKLPRSNCRLRPRATHNDRSTSAHPSQHALMSSYDTTPLESRYSSPMTGHSKSSNARRNTILSTSSGGETLFPWTGLKQPTWNQPQVISHPRKQSLRPPLRPLLLLRPHPHPHPPTTIPSSSSTAQATAGAPIYPHHTRRP